MAALAKRIEIPGSRTGTESVPRCTTLVTNDDGIDSPGLVVWAAAAVRAGLDVVVAAPARQSSGTSAGIIATTREGRPLIERRELPDLPEVEAYAVEAQPGYIVRAAVRGWLDPVPQLVVSGINHGANVGRAILHSGTVGAALTAGVNGVRGLAVSFDVGLYPAQPPYWATAAHLVPDVLEILISAPAGTVLSLNVPDRPDAVRARRRRPSPRSRCPPRQSRGPPHRTGSGVCVGGLAHYRHTPLTAAPSGRPGRYLDLS